ncbi:MAG: hypothetical protein N3D84_00295 [Candidatus Woesearchaeota archaeon]|nr:hypothetical protein [Candidatus Woesearchaeota archaeon]
MGLEIENTLIEKIKQYKLKSPEHEEIISLFEEHMLNRTLSYNGNKEEILEGILKAVDAAAERIKRNPWENCSLIEIDFCTLVAIRHPERLDDIIKEIKENRIDAYNLGEIAEKYNIKDCLQKQPDKQPHNINIILPKKPKGTYFA